MSTRRPPIAPKAAQAQAEALLHALEGHAPSPRKNSFSDNGGSLGPTRPRSPRPAEVYNAAMAELTEGDGRGLTKIKIGGPSPASSPGRRRAHSSLASCTTLNPLSPRTVSILDHTSGASAAAASALMISSLRPATTCSGGAGALLSGTASSRAFGLVGGFGALEPEQRLVSPTEGPSSANNVHTPPRKATSAPDSQSLQAQLRSASNPWRTGGDSLGPLASHAPQPPSQPQPAQSPPRGAFGVSSSSLASGGGHAASAFGAAAAGGRHLSPNRATTAWASPHALPPGQQHPIPPMPSGGGAAAPPHHQHHHSGAAAGGHTMTSPPGPPPHGLPPAGPGLTALLGAGGSSGSGRERRNSASSTDSPMVYDSPVGGPPPNLSNLRVATVGRQGSPLSPQPSTPGSGGSMPHTPTCSSLKPRPPGDAPLSSVVGRTSRKFSNLAGSPADPRVMGAGLGAGGSPHPSLAAPSSARQLHLHTVVSGMDELPRSNSIGGGTSSAPFNSSLYGVLYGGAGSQPGTPSSASRPGSGRTGSARSRPVATLVDAVRSKDDAKLAEALESLRGPQGNTLGLNDRHHVTCRTPLHEAAMSNSVSMVAALLAAGADPNIAHPTQGPPLLHSAAFGEVDTMQLLLLEGADVNAADVEHQTALHFACVGAHMDAARILIKFGADVRARNEDGQAPFDLAQPEMLRMVLAGEVASSPDRRPSSSSRPTSGAGSRTLAAVGDGGGGGGSSTGGGGGGSSRRSIGGRPPSGSSGGSFMQPASPGTVQLDIGSLTAAAGGGSGGLGSSLRPAPPTMDPAGAIAVAAGGSSGPRSRRNSGNFTNGSGAAAGAPATASTAAPPPPSGHYPAHSPPPGHSPLRHPGDGGGSTAANTPTQHGGGGGGGGGGRGMAAPASPLLSDSETVPPPPSPPTLQLPGGVRRQLSRGAVLGDIISAFQQEDAEIVKKSHPPPPPAAADATAHVTHPHHHHHHHPPGIPPGPSAAAAKAKEQPGAGFFFGGPTAGLPAAVPAVGFSPAGFTPPPQQPGGKPGKGGGGGGGDGKEKAAPPQVLLPFSMPESSMIRFGIPLQVHAAEDDDGGGDDAGGGGGSGGGGGATRQPSVPMAMPSFSAAAGVSAAVGFVMSPPAVATGAAFRPPTVTVPAVPGGGGGGSIGFSAVGFAPVPATGFTPRISNSGGGGSGGPPHRVSGNGGRMSSSGDDFNGPTPPLVRDSSPVRDRPGGGGGGNSGGAGGAANGRAGGGGGSGAAGSGGGGGGGRFAPTRTSQLAAQALKRMSNTNNVSMDAIEVRAAAMFRQSTDMKTAEMAWTRGELLGEGAYGKVYAGLNQQTGELMAVKVLQLISKHGTKDEVIAQLETLEHEMSLYKKLKNKHVVGYIDARFDIKTSAFYIFLEYVPGGSISSMLGRFGRFSEDLVRNYTRQLLMGLEYLHGCKIVHRDLKGGNVLVSRDGVVKLADFGASKAYRDTTITDAMKSVRGSVFWMAPEVIRGTGYGRRADIWSLGCTVIEMLTGAHPWPHLDNQWTAMFTIAKTEEGPPRPKGISDEAARFLDKCLYFDPAKRPTASELLQDTFVARLGAGAGSAANNEDRLQHSF